jgi:hypothetical protein
MQFLEVPYCLSGPEVGFNTVFLGNGNNWVFLSGSGNPVFDGSGTDQIWAGTGDDYFQMNAAGGADTINNFAVTDFLDLSNLLGPLGVSLTEQSLSPYVSVTEQTTGGSNPTTNTLISVAGAGGTANITLNNYDAGGLAGLLANNNLVVWPARLRTKAVGADEARERPDRAHIHLDEVRPAGCERLRDRRAKRVGLRHFP